MKVLPVLNSQIHPTQMAHPEKECRMLQHGFLIQGRLGWTDDESVRLINERR
jgi:hypothetical protein